MIGIQYSSSKVGSVQTFFFLAELKTSTSTRSDRQPRRSKSTVKIKVLPRVGNEPLSAWTCVKREMIGKVISSIVFMLGFIVVLFKKEAWHDEIAHTKVVKID